MLITKEVKLTAIGRKAEDDRYESDGGGFIVYIPQNISRSKPGQDRPRARIKVTFESV